MSFEALDAAYLALSQAPDASATAPHFQAIWAGLDKMLSSQALNSLRNRLDRQCIMMTNYYAWRWLDAYCPQQILEAWKDQGAQRAPSTWIHQLARDVRAVVERRATAHRFDSTKYNLDIGGASFDYSNRRSQIYVTEPEIFNATVSITT